MATFEVKIYKITIEEHPNADAIELAVVGEYRSIVSKGLFQDGVLAAYIPEGAVVPKLVLQRLNLWDAENDKGKLAGKQGTRVKAIRLRNVLSQGLIYPVEQTEGLSELVDPAGEHHSVVEGQDVRDVLNITKYEPQIPTAMGGEVFNAFGNTIGYDVENYKRFPDVFVEGEEVIMTEKLHGTWCCFGYHPDITHPVVTSKGLSAKGLAFKMNEANKHNVYIKGLQLTTDDSMDDVVTRHRRNLPSLEPFYFLGEIYGQGVQDLTYGVSSNTEFRVFDVYIGQPGAGRYLNYDEMITMTESLGLNTVPLLYRGPFSKEKMTEMTSGKTTIGGSHIKEGLVVKPVTERRDNTVGRVMLKSISDDYLLRKNGTEYN